MITVAETIAFQRKVEGLLSDREKADLIDYLAEHPNSGTLNAGHWGNSEAPLGPDWAGKERWRESYLLFP